MVLDFLSLYAPLLLVYSACLAFVYGYTDDYFYLRDALRHFHRIIAVCVKQGRPIDGIILNLLFSHLPHVEYLGLVRFVGISCVAVLAYTIFVAMVRAGWSKRLAWPVALAAGTLPAMQLYAAWAIESPIALGGAAAGCAAMLAAAAIDAPRRGAMLLRIGAAVLMFCVAVLFYQPVAMLFWMFFAIDFLRPSGTPERPVRRLAIFGSIAAIGLAVGFVAWKVGGRFFPEDLSGHSSTLVTDPLQKLKWFVTAPLPGALNLWNLKGKVWVAWAVGSFELVGLILYIGGSVRKRLMSLLICIALVPLAFLPNLLTSESWTLYRTQVGLEGLFLIYGFCALNGYWRFGSRLADRTTPRDETAPAWLVRPIAIGLAAVGAFTVTRYFVLPQYEELAYVRSLLTPHALWGIDRFQIVLSGWQDSLCGFCRYDEFGMPTTSYDWAAAPEVRCLVIERFPNYDRIPIRVKDNYWGTYWPPPPPGTLLLDFRELKRIQEKPVVPAASDF